MKTKKQTKLKREIQDLLGKKTERTIRVNRDHINEETRSIDLAFSSSEPYERWWGVEILDHSPGAVRMDRMKDGAAVLLDHNWEKQVGVVDVASIDGDERGRAAVRMSRSASGEEVYQDVKDGIRGKVSVGYIVHKMVLEEESKDGPDVYRVTDWEPFEVSFVSVPADASVGVGRAMDSDDVPADTRGSEDVDMSSDNKDVTPDVPVVDVKAVQSEARDSETHRVREILATGAKFNMTEKAEAAVADGTPLVKFQSDVFDSFEMPAPSTDSNIGMSAKEKKRYSISRAIMAAGNPGDAAAQNAAGFELECARAAEKVLVGERQGNLAVPNDILTRDMTVGTDADGGYLKGTDHMGSAFIDVLRNKLMLKQMGATELTGLVGDASIPKKTAGTTAYWLSTEATAVTESQATFGQLLLQPKTVGGLSEVSRQLLLQSNPSIDAMILDDIAAVLAVEVDQVGLHGDGSGGKPTGLEDTTGIGDVAGGTNGLAPAWSHIVGLETEVAQDNADIGSMGYLTNSKVRGKLKSTFPNTTGGDTPIWRNGMQPGEGELNGYRASATNNVSSTLTKGSSSGVCSAIFFGNWADMIIALWGGLDILVDPYTSSSKGILRLVAFQSVDIGVRRPESFSAMLDALTT